MKKRDLETVVTDIWKKAGFADEAGAKTGVLETPEFKRIPHGSFWSPVAVLIQTEQLIELVRLAGLEKRFLGKASKPSACRPRVQLRK